MITRMLDVSCESMPDLVDMPSEQHSTLGIKRLGVEVTARNGGKTLHSKVL